MRKEIKMKMINFFLKSFVTGLLLAIFLPIGLMTLIYFLFKTEKKLQKHDSHKSDSINSDNVIDIKTKKRIGAN